MINEVPNEEILKLYIAESLFHEGRHKEVLVQNEFEVVADRIFKSMSDTITPQGILGIIKRKEYTLNELLKLPGNCFLILEDIQDPGNLGTMIRTAEGAGVAGIIMNKGTVDVYNPKVIRSTMGSIYRVPFVIVDHLGDAVREMKKSGITAYAAHLQGEYNYYDENYDRGTALLIGNEGKGLSDEIAGLADTYIKIPMDGKVESLNASIAAAILLYEIKRKKS